MYFEQFTTRNLRGTPGAVKLRGSSSRAGGFPFSLNRLFSEVVRPGYAGLADSYPNEWESTLRQLDGKDWRTVKIEDFDSQGGILEGIQVLGLKGFMFFLPGLVRIALTQPEPRYMVAYALMTRFTQREALPQFTSTAERTLAALSLSEAQQRIAALAPAQREFLARVLTSIQESEPDLYSLLVDSAISNLRLGEIVPYRDKDLMQWLSKQPGQK